MEENIINSVNLEDILKKARQLDETSLAVLTKEYYPNIFRYFYYRVKTIEDAEDLTSDVFVRIVGSIKGQKGNFVAWLFRIARNLLIDYYRRRGSSKEVSLEDIKNTLSNSCKHTREVFDPEEIKKTFEFLTDDQKKVTTLKFIEGYTNEEISQIMNKSIGAIKLLQFRALSSLRDIFKRKLQ